MRISRQHKFVFVSTPKACTHSIYQILDTYYAGGLLERGFHCNVVPRRYRRYFRWSVCRNPFTRAISLWWSACRLAHKDQYGFRQRCGASDDFTRFIVWLSETSRDERVKEPLMMNQSQWLQKAQPIHTVHLERLADELAALPFWKEDIAVPQLNTTSTKIVEQEALDGNEILRPADAELLADPRARDAVIAWARPDFERFGYQMEAPCERS